MDRQETRQDTRPIRRLITRRRVLTGLGAGATLAAGIAAYAVGVAPFAETVTRYRLTPPGWTPGLALRLAVLTDFHFCDPWFGLDRLRHVVAQTHALRPDAILLLGDFTAGVRIGRYSTEVPSEAWARGLGELHAPLGVHAVLGNHDWWEDPIAQRRGAGPTQTHIALRDAGIRVHENTALRLTKTGADGRARAFWLAGLGDQWAFFVGRRSMTDGLSGRPSYRGVDDLPGTLAQVTDNAPVVLMVHEPDIFPKVPARVSVTVAGHTHGGQVRVFGYAPIVPSRYGRRYVYGHVVEEGRHLIVSSGLGVSGVPVRLGAAQEIVLLDLG
jgi:predicted MPP superfamily phosphohydrolase